MSRMKGDKPITKLIKGKRYDVDRAVELIRWEDKEGEQKETLYRKKTGELFIYRERYDTLLNTKLKPEYAPLDIKTAKKWVEKRFDKETVDKLFNVQKEDDKKKTISCTLSEGCLKQMTYLMEKHDKSRSGLIEMLVEKEYEDFNK